METSIHYQMERKSREEVIYSIGGYGKVIGSCVVDKGHKNGEEIHVVTDNAIIAIVNRHSLKFVTSLIARPEQLKRYGLSIPDYVMAKAKQHTEAGLNYC